ncbi:MAG: XdhC family protein [Pelagibacteraceae bacterium]|jgi:xanthine dehydrogenase accessory factor|nr:MAG: xanthine dehydrogenase [alpha proteobacterium HIMB114]|tara:strand:- start:754 stop:1434 length:681 start_codon:yes stop_codon:yes gene_type:complete
MQLNILKQIITLKNSKKEFSVITDTKTSKTYIFFVNEPLDNDLKSFEVQIMQLYNSRKDGMIKNTDLFIKHYHRPIKVVIVGAVHISQFFVEIAKSLNLDIYIIDPRGYFASEKRFPNVKIINLWPQEAFQHCPLDEKTALIALTHDPKIDDPAIQEALNKKCFYIGALGSKKTHENRCKRLTENGFKADDIKKIFGPIGIKFGGRSAPEIALSIIFQLMTEIYKK